MYGSLRGHYREVGTISSGSLYLIFALFSGLLGTAFSVLVRPCVMLAIVISDHHHLTTMMTTSDLGQRENPRLNIAYPSKANKLVIHVSNESQVVVPKVKVTLLEPYPLVTSRKGLVLAWNWYYDMIFDKLAQSQIGYIVRQVIRNDLKLESWEPKGTTVAIMELGDCLSVDAYSTYGNGVPVVGLGWGPKGDRKYPLNLNSQHNGFRYYSNAVLPVSTKREKDKYTAKGDLPRRFEKLIKICATPKDGLKLNDIYKLMFNARMYEVAYKKLKSQPGNMTPGIIPTTLDGMSMDWVEETINRMKDGSFQFNPGRRIQIPKSNGTSTRPLTIAPPRDKVVQEVMRMILEVIFEPMFSNNSHGFRPNKSCHTALRQVKTQFGAVTRIIEGDISKCFDSFNHKILITLIERKVSDVRFIQLIWKALRAGYMEFHNVQNSIVGTPQGSIISPILANIYLHEFDLFIDKLKESYDTGKESRRNPLYRKMEYLRAKANRAGDFEQGVKYLKEMQRLKSRLPDDPTFRRMYYVRYADDWILGIRGPRSDAVNTLQTLRKMLEYDLKLSLSVVKSKITNPRREPALFLGTLISISKHVSSTMGKNHQRLRVVSQIRMLAPLDKIFNKLIAASFMSAKHKSGIPKFIWYHNDKDNILALYNSVLRGYLNYYSFAHNYPKVASSLEFILKTSCAKLLAAKFKLRSVSKVIGMYGTDLKGAGKVAFLKPNYKIDVWDFKSKPKDRIKTLYASYLSAATLGGLECTKRGSKVRVEMHHVRLLSDLNPKLTEIDKIMAKRKRKQIPLCRVCHLDHHKNHKPWGKSGSRK